MTGFTTVRLVIFIKYGMMVIITELRFDGEAMLLAMQARQEEKPWVRITEGRLYAYPVLKTILLDLKAQNRYFYPLGATAYDGIGIHGQGQTSNPAYQNMMKKEMLVIKCDDKFDKYLREADMIEQLAEICNYQEKELLERRYFQNRAIITVMHELNMSKSLYYRVRDLVITRAAVIFGYLEYDEYIKMLA